MTSFSAGTTFANQVKITKEWYVIDADGLVLGRLATEVAEILRGKHKPYYTPHLDCGDNVVIINAHKIQVTGKKLENRVFHWHTSHPGGIKQRTIKERLTGKAPEKVVEKSIERMMPKDSPLARKQMKCLHIYANTEHSHQAQKPKVLDLASRNRKNKR